MNKVSFAKTITVLPGATFPIAEAGDFFYVIEATGRIKIRTSRAGFEPYMVGTGKRLKHGQFDWLEIRNETTNPIRVAIYGGFCRYIDKRLNVFSGRVNGEAERPGGVSAPLILGASARSICSAGIITLSDGETFESGGEDAAQYAVTCFALDPATITEVRIGGVISDVIASPRVEGEYRTSLPVEFKNVSGSDKEYVFFSTQLSGCNSSAPSGLLVWEMQVPQGGGLWVPLAPVEFPFSGPAIAAFPFRVTNLSGSTINVPAGVGTVTAPPSPFGNPDGVIGAIGPVLDGQTLQNVFGASGGEQSLTGTYTFSGSIPGFVSFDFTQNFTYDA